MGRRSAAEELRSSHACFTRALAPKLHSTDLHQYPEQLEVLWLSQWWERRLVGHTQRPVLIVAIGPLQVVRICVLVSDSALVRML